VPRVPTIVADSVLSSSLVFKPLMVIHCLERWLGARPDMDESEALLRSMPVDRFAGASDVLVARFSILVGGTGSLLLVTRISHDPLSIATTVL
jgi:hypothetical protein